MTPIERVLAKLPDAKQAGKGWSARCPAHEDRRASLSIAEGHDGRALLKCHAGCDLDAICAAVDLRVAELMPTAACSTNMGNGKPRIEAHYDYRDEAGNVLFQVVRYEPKDFRQRRPKQNGGWAWSVNGVRVVPYRLPELAAQPAASVFICEGEKDVNNLGRIGVVATCNAGGAGKWRAEHAAFLPGRRVIVLPHNDDAGRNHAKKVAQSLQGTAESVRIVELPGLPATGDVSDWIAAGGTKEELVRLAEAAPIWTPTVAEPWPEIIAFDAQALSDFPTPVLPDALRQWVERESLATQTPADLAGMLALAVCSAVIARRVVVEARPGWREPVNLFLAVLLEPGNRKSAVFADATAPIRKLETELIEAARSKVARAESNRRQDKARLQRLEKKAAGEKDAAEAREQACVLAAELANEPEPVLPRLIVDDATSEKLGMMLAEQGGRLASMSAEGCVLDLMGGLYTKSGTPHFDVYLKGHSGDDLVTDRVSRKSVRVERPALTCLYTIQPQVIRGLANKAAFRGRGLLARFLYSAPRSWIGRRQIAPPPVSDAVHERYERVVRSLAAVEGENVLQIATEAEALLQEWQAEIEGMLDDGGPMETMRDWGAKLAGATLRIGAVLHCVEHGCATRIGRSAIEAAIAIARYLIPHAEAVLQMMDAWDDEVISDGRYLLNWVRRHKRLRFSKRDAHQDGRRRFPKADDINPALTELVRRGYIRPQATPATGSGRPPSPTYDVNPAFLASEIRDERSQNPQNSTGTLASDNFGDSENVFARADATKRVQVTI
jgi:hypothetical protein